MNKQNFLRKRKDLVLELTIRPNDATHAQQQVPVM